MPGWLGTNFNLLLNFQKKQAEISEHGMPNLPTLSRLAPRRLQVQTSPFTFDGHQVRSHPDRTKEFRREI